MPKSPARKTITVDAVYDIESEGWGKFLVGGMRKRNGEYIERTWVEERRFASEIREGTVWAHNGGVFDHKWWLSASDGRSAKIAAAGGRIVQVESEALRLRDSKALAKLSLEDFTRGLGVTKQSHGLSCNTPELCGEKCRGYCRFRRDMEARDFQVVRDYLRADCDSLFLALERLQEWGEKHDLDLCSTIGSSAWASAKRLLGLPDASLSLAAHCFVRSGYFGGRVQVFRPRTATGFEYDVNALYPSNLAAMELPCGEPVSAIGHLASSYFNKGREGVVHALVSVPEMWVPPLPYRCKDRIAYPTGTFSGHWTCLELRYASQFCNILEIREGIFWPEKRNIFKPWVEKLWELRRDAEGGKSGPFGTFLKFYMNSLTGKLGMRPSNKKYVFNPEHVKPNYEPLGAGVFAYDGEEVRKTKDGRWVAGAPCCHVEWAAYLTALGRIRWHAQAVSGKFDDMVMGDTDSVFAIGERSNEIGDELGEWQPKGAFKDFQAIAPKFYRYFPLEKGKQLVRSKGVRAKNEAEFHTLFERGSHNFSWSSSRGFRDAARNGKIFSEKQFDRRIKIGYGDRIFIPSEGITRPPTIQEAMAA